MKTHWMGWSMVAGLLLAPALLGAAAEPYAVSPDDVQPLGVGGSVPDVSLSTLQGDSIRLKDALGGKPTVLVFFRGGWCPFCRRQLAGLQQVVDELSRMGYQLIAVSPDRLKSVSDVAGKEGLDYTLLGDTKMEAIAAFGLGFKLDDATLRKYKEYGIDLVSAPGTGDKVLPVPAVYLVDASGRILFVHYDPDYKQRLDSRAVIAAARAAQQADISSVVQTETIEYHEGDTVMKGYLAYPADAVEPRAGVLVFHEWYGLNEYAKRRARQLADLGYVAFAADMYGEGTVAADAQEAGRLAGAVKGDRPLMRRRCRAALDVLTGHRLVDAERVAAIGYCFGGTCALELARSGAPVRGVVSFHGGLTRDVNTPNEAIHASILACHGAEDPHVPREEVAAFEKEMREANADWMLVEYGGAVHSFTNPKSGSRPETGVAYNPLADLRSWEQMKAFFREVLE